jgi:hypothetical protein
MSAVPAAISNALHGAFGVRLHRAPFTPERVWRAVRDAKDRGAAPAEEPTGIPSWWTATDQS